MSDEAIRLLHVMSVPESFHFLRGQIKYMREHGFVISAVASPGAAHEWFREQEGVSTTEIDMQRSFTPVRDLLALIRLIRLLRRQRPHIVHAHTPKGGLLGMLAAWIARTPVRIYHMRGLPFTTARGPRRAVLAGAEWLSCALAHRVFCVSHSLRQVALDHRLCPPDKIATFLQGSGNGVDAAGHFSPQPGDEAIRARVRGQHVIPGAATVVGFVGRLVRDKGLVELGAAWRIIRDRHPDAHLLLVGAVEARDPVPAATLEALRNDVRVHFGGAVGDVRSQYLAMDVVTLPSYREGFPNVLLEAAALALPVVTTSAPGCVDAVAHGETGLVVLPRDIASLADALSTYVRDGDLRRDAGRRGRERALRDFQQDAIWSAMNSAYRSLLSARVRPSVSRLPQPPVRAPRLLHITTVPETLGFFRGQVGFMKDQGLDVHALSSPGADLDAFGEREHVAVHGVEMRRSIAPLQDLVSLWRIARTVRRIRPDILHAHTPKGGLLGMLAALMTGVPVRIYHIHGFPFMTGRGYKRLLLRLTERISCSLAHEVYCVSHSLRAVAISERVCPPDKIKVILRGSINGVDSAERFNPAVQDGAVRARVREELGIPADAFVIGFVGRLARDKGVRELVTAFHLLRNEFAHVHLLVVGPFEPHDPLPSATMAALRGDVRIQLVGPADAAPMMAAMDAVALPSYREGFPNVPLEAASMGLPVVATDVPGCIDAVVDGVTGRIVPVCDAHVLAVALRGYVERPEVGRAHGSAGRARVIREFVPRQLWDAMYEEYSRLLDVHGIRERAPASGAAPQRMEHRIPVRVELGHTRSGEAGRPDQIREY